MTVLRGRYQQNVYAVYIIINSVFIFVVQLCIFVFCLSYELWNNASGRVYSVSKPKSQYYYYYQVLLFTIPCGVDIVQYLIETTIIYTCTPRYIVFNGIFILKRNHFFFTKSAYCYLIALQYTRLYKTRVVIINVIFYSRVLEMRFGAQQLGYYYTNTQLFTQNIISYKLQSL